MTRKAATMIRCCGTSRPQGLFKQVHSFAFPHIPQLGISAKTQPEVPILGKLSILTHSTTTIKHSFRLYTYFCSSCSARLHIALALRGIPAGYTDVNIITGKNKGPEYATLNPSRSVPTLEITKADVEGSTAMSITQSLAALEYLDEAYSETYQLLPSTKQVGLRAVIRTLCHIIASGM